jgi:hypothetical protein
MAAMARNSATVGAAELDDLIATATSKEEWIGRIEYLPLG